MESVWTSFLRLYMSSAVEAGSDVGKRHLAKAQTAARGSQQPHGATAAENEAASVHGEDGGSPLAQHEVERDMICLADCERLAPQMQHLRKDDVC